MEGATTSSTSSSLIRGLKADDPDAWRRLALVFGPLVYAWCRQAGLAEKDVGDVTQEVFLSVYRSVKGFRCENPGDTFHGWLWQISRNAVRAFFRRHAHQPQAAGGTQARQQLNQIPQFFDSTGPPQEPGTRAFIVRRALDVLREEFQPHTWRAFWRTTVDEQDAPAVAEELDMSPVAVRNAKHRVLKRLRDYMMETD